MPYQKANLGVTRAQDLGLASTSNALQASTVQTATGNGTAVELGDKTTLRLYLQVTAASGTSPSLTVNIQGSPDGATWTTNASYAAQTTTTAGTGVYKIFTGVDRFVRVTWTISGTTPSFTFTVVGEAL